MNETFNRRRMLVSTLGTAGALAAGGSMLGDAADAGLVSRTDAVLATAARRRIGISTYSYWGFRRDEFRSIERCIDLAGNMGFDGVEILEVQMTDRTIPALQAIKRRAFLLGLDLMGLSTHQGFLTPDAAKRRESFDHTVRCIEIAHELGIPTMRVNTGRWGTSANFDELMANRGIEPPLPGHDDEEGFGWVIDAFGELVPIAERHGVVLGLENHWGLGRTAAGVMRIVEAVDSPWLMVTMDTGNFLDDMYAQLTSIAPRTALVQAKTYQGGGRWYTLDIDYQRVARILDDAGFRGWISLEFEGNADPLTAIPESLELLRSTIGRRDLAVISDGPGERP